MRAALLCIALAGCACSAPFTAAPSLPDAGVDAFGPDTPWPASRLDGEAPAHPYDDDAALEDVADAGVLALADDAADAPDTALDWRGCVAEGNCGGNWWRFDCGEAGPPKGSHCISDNSAHGVCCYDTIKQGDQ